MMRYLFLFLLTFFSAQTIAQIEKLNPLLYSKFESANLASITTIKDLAIKLKPLAATKEESLLLLYFWTYKYMSADSLRFFKGTAPLTVNQSLKNRVGLCEEFSNIFHEYCKLNQITSLKIEGYVRPKDFRPGQIYQEGNHIWNAVLLNSKWLLCDLLWSTTTLRVGESLHFVKDSKPDFYLANPDFFLPTHLPLATVFQFTNTPVSMDAFINVTSGLDSTQNRLPPINYKDSLNNLISISEADRALKIAKQAYFYNKNNPNNLITTAYNNAIEIINRQNCTTAELKKARNCLNLFTNYIHLSKKPNVLYLKESGAKALVYVNKRLALAK